MEFGADKFLFTRLPTSDFTISLLYSNTAFVRAVSLRLYSKHKAMTALVSILNKKAAVMAADSAVTISKDGKTRIYNRF